MDEKEKLRTLIVILEMAYDEEMLSEEEFIAKYSEKTDLPPVKAALDRIKDKHSR